MKKLLLLLWLLWLTVSLASAPVLATPADAAEPLVLTCLVEGNKASITWTGLPDTSQVNHFSLSIGNCNGAFLCCEPAQPYTNIFAISGTYRVSIEATTQDNRKFAGSCTAEVEAPDALDCQVQGNLVSLDWSRAQLPEIAYRKFSVFRNRIKIAETFDYQAHFSTGRGAWVFSVRMNDCLQVSQCHVQVDDELRFRRGDANQDGALDLVDGIHLLEGLFIGGRTFPCADAADANDSGQLDISDAILIFRHLFLGSEALPPPGSTSCGLDPGEDELECMEYSLCGQ